MRNDKFITRFGFDSHMRLITVIILVKVLTVLKCLLFPGR